MSFDRESALRNFEWDFSVPAMKTSEHRTEEKVREVMEQLESAASMNEQEAKSAYTSVVEQGQSQDAIRELKALQEAVPEFGQTYWSIKDTIEEFQKALIGKSDPWMDQAQRRVEEFRQQEFESENAELIKQNNYEEFQRQVARDDELLRQRRQEEERAQMEADAANDAAINDPDSDFEFDDDTEAPAKNPNAPLPLKGADVSGLDQAVKMQAWEQEIDPLMNHHVGTRVAVRPDLNRKGYMSLHPIVARRVEYTKTLDNYSGPLVLKNARANTKDGSSIVGTVQNRIPRGYKKGPEIKPGDKFTNAQYVIQEGDKTYKVVKD